MDKYKVWIEAEQWADGEWDIYNDNTDVIIEYDSGDRWIASFFTYGSLNNLVDKNKRTGECLNGKYFWSTDMILVDEISRERIEEVIKYLIIKDEIECIFKKIYYDDNAGIYSSGL